MNEGKTKVLKAHDLINIQMAVDSMADSVKTLAIQCSILSKSMRDNFPQSFNISETKFLTVKDVREKLKVSIPQVYSLIYKGKIEAIRIGKRGIRISEVSLNNYLGENRILPLDLDSENVRTKI